MEQKVKIKVEQVDNGCVFKWYSGDLGVAGTLDKADQFFTNNTEFLVAKKKKKYRLLAKGFGKILIISWTRNLLHKLN